MIHFSTVRMTSPLDVQIVEKNESKTVRKRAKRAFWEALAEVDRLTELLSEYREHSEISRVNQQAGQQAVAVSPETAQVLRLALAIAHSTNGAFDPTFRPLLDLWDYNQEHITKPSEASIAEALQKVDFRQVAFDPCSHQVRLGKPGMRLGLGGVAKGFIVQSMVKVFQLHGFHNFLVNAGGDIYASGTIHGKSWNIGVPDPKQPGQMAFTVPVQNAAFCTSACYERYVMIEGKRYGHILNPKSGYPVEYTQGVTVIANQMAYADAIATTIFILGPQHGLQFANQLRGTEAILFDGNGELHMTDGLTQQKVAREFNHSFSFGSLPKSLQVPTSPLGI